MKAIIISTFMAASLCSQGQDTLRSLTDRYINNIWIDTSNYLRYNSDTVSFLDNSTEERTKSVSGIIDLQKLKKLERIKNDTPCSYTFTYLTDNESVYMIRDVYGGPIIKVLESVDIGSFKVLNEHWTKDESRVYFQGEPVEDAHAPSFRTFKPKELSISFWGRDKYNIFEGHYKTTEEYRKEYGVKIEI